MWNCLFNRFAAFPVYCNPLDPTLPLAGLGATVWLAIGAHVYDARSGG